MLLPSITTPLLDDTIANLTSDGYEWARELDNMSQHEIDCFPTGYTNSCAELLQLHGYINRLADAYLEATGECF